MSKLRDALFSLFETRGKQRKLPLHWHVAQGILAAVPPTLLWLGLSRVTVDQQILHQQAQPAAPPTAPQDAGQSIEQLDRRVIRLEEALRGLEHSQDAKGGAQPEPSPEHQPSTAAPTIQQRQQHQQQQLQARQGHTHKQQDTEAISRDGEDAAAAAATAAAAAAGSGTAAQTPKDSQPQGNSTHAPTTETTTSSSSSWGALWAPAWTYNWLPGLGAPQPSQAHGHPDKDTST
eukprot:m.384956 g.384956  ORF g.384956 m.384956 type:complete len:233 (-) comp20050_c6_seq3:3155-3853(-)